MRSVRRYGPPGVLSIVGGLRAELEAVRAMLAAERDASAALRAELLCARAAVREANEAAGEILARGPLATLEAAAGADTLS